MLVVIRDNIIEFQLQQNNNKQISTNQDIIDLKQNNSEKYIMINTNIFTMIFECTIWLFILYSVYRIIKRKLSKPDYTGKNVWITGASSGIGQYLAYEFNRNGANLIISARNTDQLNRVKQNMPNKNFPVKVVKLDMSDYLQVQKVTAEIIGDLQKNEKRLDVVVENAGVSMRCEFKDYPFQNHLSMFNVNVNGPYRHLQCIVPHMMKNKSGQIVGISSVAGKIGPAYRTSYAGSKHALIGIFDSLRSQLTPHNIKVTSILPGYVKTNISKNALSAEEGQAFGKTDNNIQKGMNVDKFARQAIRSIFRGQNQAQISESWLIPIAVQLRNICPDLAFRGMLWNVKNQTKAVKGAKSD